jgi:hypothetical protein
MTLKEKFKQWLDTEPRVQIREVQLEVIAEDFAMRFGFWLIDMYYINPNWECRTMRELLDIYKKEQEL